MKNDFKTLFPKKHFSLAIVVLDSDDQWSKQEVCKQPTYVSRLRQNLSGFFVLTTTGSSSIVVERSNLTSLCPSVSYEVSHADCVRANGKNAETREKKSELNFD